MSWFQRYRIRHYLQSSIWVVPSFSTAVALVSVALLHRIEQKFGWRASVSPETARAVLGTMAASMFTFIVFVSSALLVAFQLASASLTPRIIGLVFKDPVTKYSLAIFTFTFCFTLAVLLRVNDTVPLLTSYIAAYGCLLSLGVFLFLIDHVGKVLRPSGALGTVGKHGRQIIENVYPVRLSQSKGHESVPVKQLYGEPATVVLNKKDGVVLAFDLRGLVSIAQRADCVVELVPQVGDFVAVDDPLFRILNGGATLSEESVRQCVAFSFERTMEQDPTFAFRIIVDIASKGLSPGINDPTTAVLAIDQIHHLLRTVGNRQLADGHELDSTGELRLVYRTPDWEDFVHLAVTEIRQYGRDSVQVTRRLRAMLENLINTLPENRAHLLQVELNLLARTVERNFADLEDRTLAGASDLQGMGGDAPQESEDRETQDADKPEQKLKET